MVGPREEILFEGLRFSSLLRWVGAPLQPLLKNPKLQLASLGKKFSNISSLVFAEKYSNIFVISRSHRVLKMVYNSESLDLDFVHRSEF
jgi:hypothetical protein